MQFSGNMFSQRLEGTYEAPARVIARTGGPSERNAGIIRDPEGRHPFPSSVRTSGVWDPAQLYAIDSAYRGAWRVLCAVHSPLVRRQRSRLTRAVLWQRINAKVASGLLDIDQLRADSLTFVHRYYVEAAVDHDA